jgi:hypothetical protein
MGDIGGADFTENANACPLDVPPKVKCAATQMFAVLKYIHQQLLPSLKLSIHQFIDFLLPKPAAVACVVPISEFFSCYDPKPMTERLLDLDEEGSSYHYHMLCTRRLHGWQPLDVGIQRVLKQRMKRSAHKDIVTEVTT